MADDFKYDVFLSHSSKDRQIVRDIAKRLRADGLRVWFEGWEIKPRTTKVDRDKKIEEALKHSRVLVLCVSVNAFSTDWTLQEARTFRFRNPLDKERRFILLRLDATSIIGPLAQFSFLNWTQEHR
jgi:TIR domain